MESKKSVYKNYIYNIGYQILIMILPLITTPYLSRVLGPDALGQYSYTQSITYYFILFGTVGLNVYGQREAAYVQADRQKISKLFCELMILRVAIHIASICVYCSMIAIFGKYKFLFFIQTIDIIASMVDITWLYQGLEDFKRIVIRNFFIKIIGTVLIFVLVKNSNDLWIYVLCYSLTTLIGNLSLWLFLPKILIKFSIKEIAIKKHLATTFLLFLPQIATSIYNVLDRTMIGVITGINAEVAFYEQAQKIVKLALSFVTSLGVVVMPRIASIFAQNDERKIDEYIMNSFRFVWALGVPLMLGLVGITKGLVPWFFGSGYDKVIPNIIMISPIILIIGLSNVVGVQYFLPTGMQKAYLISVLCGSGVNFIVNMLLIRVFQSTGAAIASVIAETCVLIIQLVIVRKKFAITNICKVSIHYWIAGGAMFLGVITTSKLVRISVLGTVLEVVIGIVIYGLVLLLFNDSIWVRVKNKIIK